VALGGLGLGGLTLSGCAPTTRADAAVKLKCVDVHPADYPTVEAVKWMGDELARLTDGRIGVRQFPAGQLGSEDDSIGLTRFQAVDVCRVAVAALNNAFPETRILALPYVFRSVAHVRAVVDGSIGTDLLNVFEGRGLVGLAYYDAAPRSFYNVRRPVAEPGQLRGLKIRAPQSDIFLESIRAMGANPTPLTFGAVFSSLQTHLIDGAENNWPSYDSSGHFEVAKYYTLNQHLIVPEVLVMSKTSFDKLSAEEQEIVRQAARDSVPLMRELWQEREKVSEQRVRDAGVEIITDIDKTPFIEAMVPVYQKYVTSPKLQQMVADIQATE